MPSIEGCRLPLNFGLLPLPVGPIHRRWPAPFAPQPLQLLHHYYKLLRHSVLHWYSHPYGFSHLDFSLAIKTTASRSSVEKPESDSRHLYTGHRLHNIQFACRLILGYLSDPSFDVTSVFRCFNSGSGLFVFLILTCQIYLAFHSTLTTIALYNSRLSWFEACY